ncbi:RNA polymerase sigma factor [Anoxybacillus rupiensis]|uniref:RNA polymerase sigma factor n=1 Tax=Anoxybacteroides rupiense TaxID=311460 RepID=A0ABT5W7Q0_9BACL|nr:MULTISPECIES: RNA polymerase sigma factor [Anoxybacillus]MBS2772590.1 RNA polymerase sigma factor [Anoxybacillus rupiensis]MDE8564101.1 RNA polymerase sigma factor [Anoxybacillus rupiensis]QHC04010.1 sigma-70 family RNA polymerase sigma factor [Anoxybacillus sp. PDR2]
MEKIKEWITKVKKGDHNAANQLVSFYYKDLYAYIYRQTLNKDLAMDLTQEAFISMLRSIHSYDERKASFRTWLYRIATYQTIDYYRSKYYKQQPIVTEIDHELGQEEDFTLKLEYKEEVERILAVLNTFEASAQQIFRLKLFGEYTFAEIASATGLTESTVKTKFYSTVRKIGSNIAIVDWKQDFLSIC